VTCQTCYPHRSDDEEKGEDGWQAAGGAGERGRWPSRVGLPADPSLRTLTSRRAARISHEAIGPNGPLAKRKAFHPRRRDPRDRAGALQVRRRHRPGRFSCRRRIVPSTDRPTRPTDLVLEGRSARSDQRRAIALGLGASNSSSKAVVWSSRSTASSARRPSSSRAARRMASGRPRRACSRKMRR